MLVGTHVGGYDEFSVDITDEVKAYLLDCNVFEGKVPLTIRCDNSRKIQLYNGRAYLKILMQKDHAVVSAKSDSIPACFLEL